MSTFVKSYKRRKIFLDQLAVGASVSFAASAAGGSTGNFRRWRKDDPDFAADWDEAIEEGTDFIEDAATDRALKKSDPLMAMILKARRPEKYDRAGKLELSGGISVEGARTKLLNRIARLQAEGAVLESPSPEESEIPSEEPADTEQKLLPAPDQFAPVRGRKRRAAAQGSRREEAA